MNLADTLRKIIHLIDETQYRCDVQRLKIEHVCEDYRNLMKKWIKKRNVHVTEEQVSSQNENIQQYSPDDKVDNLLAKAKKVKEKYKSSNTKSSDDKQSSISSVKSSQTKSMVQVKQNKLQKSNREFTAACVSKSCDKMAWKSKQNVTTAVLPRSKFVKLKTELQKSDENLSNIEFKSSITSTTTERMVNEQMPNINKNVSRPAKIGKSEIIVVPEIPERLKRAIELNLQARSKAKSFWRRNNNYAKRFEIKLLQNMEIWEDGNELRENCDLGQLCENENLKEFSFTPKWLWHWDDSFPDIPEVIDYSAVEELRRFYGLLLEVQWLSFLLNLYKSIDGEIFSHLCQMDPKDSNYLNVLRCLHGFMCTEGERFPILISKR